MTRSSTVVPLRQPDEGGDPPTAVLRSGPRRVLTPDPLRPDDVVVHAVDDGTITLSTTPETVAPGRYGLWFADGAGHARIGDVVATDAGAGAVVRELIGVDRGELVP